MKKYLPILSLYARSTVWKLFVLLAAMAAAEIALFYGAVRNDYGPEQVFCHSKIALAALIIFVLWSIVLSCVPLSHASYTMNRLDIDPHKLFYCHVVYNALCYVVLWAFQTLLLIGIFALYGGQVDPAIHGPQSILFAFYDQPFLHGLLPMLDWTRYLRNLISVGALGVMTAVIPVRLSRGKGIIAPAVLALIVFPWAFLQNGGYAFDLIISAVFLLYASVINISAFAQEENYETQAYEP